MANLIYCLTACLIAAFILELQAAPPEKVVSGQEVIGNEFPFLVSLRRRKSNQHFCGGSILSRKHILTAAHCMEEETADSILVFVGSKSLVHGGAFYKVKKVLASEQYDSSTIKFDIAVLTLDSPLLDGNWKVSKLASRDYPPGTPAIIAGWGHTVQNDTKVTIKLRKLHTKIADNSQCSETLSIHFKHNLCTLPIRYEGACQGDSGGPLIVNNEVVGISSFTGPVCGKYPSVFAKVLTYRNFIKRAMMSEEISEEKPEKKGFLNSLYDAFINYF